MDHSFVHQLYTTSSWPLTDFSNFTYHLSWLSLIILTDWYSDRSHARSNALSLFIMACDQIEGTLQSVHSRTINLRMIDVHRWFQVAMFFQWITLIVLSFVQNSRGDGVFDDDNWADGPIYVGPTPPKRETTLTTTQIPTQPPGISHYEQVLQDDAVFPLLCSTRISQCGPCVCCYAAHKVTVLCQGSQITCLPENLPSNTTHLYVYQFIIFLSN